MGVGTVQCDGLWLTSRVQNSRYKSILHSKVIARFSKRLNITPTHLQAIINWEALGKARKEARLQQKIFITKWVSDVVPTGVVMCERKQKLQR